MHFLCAAITIQPETNKQKQASDQKASASHRAHSNEPLTYGSDGDDDDDDDVDDDERFEAQLNSLVSQLERRSAKGLRPPLAGSRLLNRLALLAGGSASLQASAAAGGSGSGHAPAPHGPAGARGASAAAADGSASASHAPMRYSTPNLLLSTNFEHIVRQRDKVSSIIG